MVWLHRPCSFHCTRPVTMYILFIVWYQWPWCDFTDHVLFIALDQWPCVYPIHCVIPMATVISIHCMASATTYFPLCDNSDHEFISSREHDGTTHFLGFLSLSRKCRHLWHGRVVCTDSAWRTCASCWPQCPPALPPSSGLVLPASARQTSGFPTTGWVSTYGYTGVETVSNIAYVFSRFSVGVCVRACMCVCVCMHVCVCMYAHRIYIYGHDFALYKYCNYYYLIIKQ